MRILRLLAFVLIAALPLSAAHAETPPVREADAVLRDVAFGDGGRLPELRIHYRTLGTPTRDAQGRIDNAVMILHGTGGSGAQFLQPRFADELFGPGQPLDAQRYFIVLPDNIGHGGSSKPSDGLRARFPRYDYADMVAIQHRFLTEALDVEGLRLIMGTSMGCMHIFDWGQRHPRFARALMPLACQPAPIGDRNRVWRKAAMDAIRADPAWRGGDYETQPLQGLRTASSLSVLVGIAPLNLHAAYPDRDGADAWWAERFAADIGSRDANDWLYQLDASRHYDPSPGLERIVAPTTWVNSADDFINPPELGIAERALPRLKTTRYVLIPASPETRGHGTHTSAVFWKQALVDLLARSEDANP
ncbi:alpha/beta fold hydrolase [Luteimonas sp. Y-2-2-4F]|nr:alpha/beta fold hydrolase [Luteimonas sp. Y-2-2-4F]MCD9031646.1 alpha/beta fold hydrolase [Luteimonas sp. Y-2-2-4F]MCD9031779.1 alpha/beta fold hydrolase [Luteimonas sp. Y-2-2-4F]